MDLMVKFIIKLINLAILTQDGITLGVTLLYPESTGSVKLKSSNFEDHPIIVKNKF